MNANAIARCLGSAFLLLVGGCATSKVRVVYNHSEQPRPGQLSSYAWLPSDPQSLSQDAPVTPPEIDAAIREAVERELAAKGYDKQTAGTPSFWISQQAVAKRRTQVAPADGAYPDAIRRYTGNASEDQTRVIEYDEGTLVLACVSANDPQLYWRATATDKVELDAPAARRNAHLGEAVGRILRRFPDR